MLFSVVLAIAMKAHVSPALQVNYEVESLALEVEVDAPTYHRVSQRYESDSTGRTGRFVVKRDGTTAIITGNGKQITFESIAPDGTRQSTTKPIGSLKSFGDVTKFFGNTEDLSDMKFKSVPSDRKETKAIVGVPCIKSVGRFDHDGTTYEYVTWMPVGKAYEAWGLPPLETYIYSLDGETRKLESATVTTSVKFGKTKPKKFPGA